MTDLTFTADEQPKMSAFNERFSVLNGLYQHWWKRRTVSVAQTTHEGLVINKTKTNNNYPTYLYYTDAGYTLNGDVLSLIAPTQIEQFSYTILLSGGREQLLNGKYFSMQQISTSGRSDVNETFIYYGTSNASQVVDSTDTYQYQVQIDCIEYFVQKGEWSYIYSDNADAYPASGILNGYEYQYLGVPFENAREASKIATGSYTGTGTYGEDNPNTLTFDFKPEIVLISATGAGYWPLFSISALTSSYISSAYALIGESDAISGDMWAKFDDASNALYWYHASNALGQGNQSSHTYHYVALG